MTARHAKACAGRYRFGMRYRALALALLVVPVACASAPGSSHGAPAADAPAAGDDAKVEQRTIVEKTLGGGTRTRVITTTTRTEEVPSPAPRPADHKPHAHFAANAQGSPVFGPRIAENQGDPSGVPPMDRDATTSGKKAIALLLKIMIDEGPGGGHHDNMLNPKYRRVGIGLHYAGGKLYLTNDFSD
jgi:hypothetical protein